jgi:hypothetical protein
MKPPESDRSRFDDSQPEGPVFSLGDLFSVETFYQETDEEKRFNLLQTLPVPMLKLLITASLLDTGSYEVIQKLAKLNSTEVFLEALSRALTVRYVIQVPGGHQGELRYKVDPELKAFINGPMQLRHDLESNYRRLQLPSYQEFLGADLAQQEAIWMSFPQELQWVAEMLYEFPASTEVALQKQNSGKLESLRPRKLLTQQPLWVALRILSHLGYLEISHSGDSNPVKYDLQPDFRTFVHQKSHTS